MLMEMREALCILLGGHHYRTTKWRGGPHGWHRVRHCVVCKHEAWQHVTTSIRPLDVV